ncbi:MAG: tetratricopeptide repeat protein [Acidobacteriota bacterium]|nr:tetratricopeptide repeat protein [Acidobacteriota bacterium]
MPVKSIKINSFASRTILSALALFCLIIAFFFAKWCLANALATQADFKELADIAVAAAPDDPQTHQISAILLEKTFLPEDLSKSVEEYEKATALSPHNYLYWLALGRAREQTGDADGAEKALRKASQLAPNYAQVRWTLGNALLRQEKSAEAVSEIRRAIQSDPNLTSPAISAFWQIYEGDVSQTRQAIGDSSEANAALAVFLARQSRFDEASEIWNSLPSELKATGLKKSGEELLGQFTAAKKYRAAQRISAEIFGGEAVNAAFEQITNGGFEADVKMQNAGIFEWQIADGSQPQIGLDNQIRRSGERSLLLIFNSTDGKTFRPVSQTATVAPEKSYRLSVFFKAELKTSAGLKWEIADAADGKILGSTAAIAGNADWTNAAINFTTAKTTEAVIIRLTRENCQSLICPISGKIWFDDFSLTAANNQ